MNRRTFLQAAALYAIGTAYATEPLQKIVVNLPSYTLALYEGRVRKIEFPCRIGRPATPTPIGKGEIILKRDRVVFRYLTGPNRGKVIWYSYLDPEKRTIKMPYDDMRGLDFTINGRMTGPVIHSTTDHWTVGASASHGCIGMKIEDMLVLYGAIPEGALPELEITYRTLFYDRGQMTVWHDVYSKGTNTGEALLGVLREAGIGSIDAERADANLERIGRELEAANKKVQALLSAGKDPKEELGGLSVTLPLEALLEAPSD